VTRAVRRARSDFTATDLAFCRGEKTFKAGRTGDLEKDWPTDGKRAISQGRFLIDEWRGACLDSFAGTIN